MTQPSVTMTPDQMRSVIAEIRVLAAWYAGCAPSIAAGLRPEHFAELRDRALWTAILERGEPSTDANFAPIQERAKEVAGLEANRWYGYWEPIRREAEGYSQAALPALMQANAQTLIEQSHSRRADARPAPVAATAPLFTGEPLLAARADRFTLHACAEALFPLPPIPWIVDGLLRPGSVSLWYGKPGSKKTYVMMVLALCVAAGKQWMGYSSRTCNVLLVDEESGEARMRQRLAECMRGVQVGGETPLHYITQARFKLHEPQDVARLAALIESAQIGLVIIDSLAATTSGDENSKQDAQIAMDALRDIAQDTGAHVAVIHHSGKNGSNRGSSVYEAGPDLVVHITSEDGSPFIHFRTDKHRDGAPMRWDAQGHWADNGDPNLNQFSLQLAPRQDPEKPTSPLKQWIADYLAENGVGTGPEIIEAAVGASMGAPASIRIAINQMVHAGIVRRANPGQAGRGVAARYALIEPQEEQAEELEE